MRPREKIFASSEEPRTCSEKNSDHSEVNAVSCNGGDSSRKDNGSSHGRND